MASTDGRSKVNSSSSALSGDLCSASTLASWDANPASWDGSSMDEWSASDDSSKASTRAMESCYDSAWMRDSGVCSSPGHWPWEPVLSARERWFCAAPRELRSSEWAQRERTSATANANGGSFGRSDHNLKPLTVPGVLRPAGNSERPSKAGWAQSGIPKPMLFGGGQKLPKPYRARNRFLARRTQWLHSPRGIS